MSSCRAIKLSGTFGAIQIGACDQAVLTDTSSRNYDTAGHLHVDHVFHRLPIADAYRLHKFLSKAIVAAGEAEPHQPGVWSNVTIQGPTWRAS